MIGKEMLQGVKFNVFYKPILFLSAFILGFSLFVSVIGVSQWKVQLTSLLGVIYGTLAWFVNNILLIYEKNINWKYNTG